MATKDLEAIQESIRYRVEQEHKKYYPSKHNKDWVADDFWIESIARKLGSDINESYRSIDQIKEAVAYEEPNTWRTDESFRERDELRREILQSLNIEGD